MLKHVWFNSVPSHITNHCQYIRNTSWQASPQYAQRHDASFHLGGSYWIQRLLLTVVFLASENRGIGCLVLWQIKGPERARTKPTVDVCCIGWYGHHVLARLFSRIRLNKVWRRVWIWCHAESTAKDANGPSLASKIKDWYHLYHISSSDLPRYPIQQRKEINMIYISLQGTFAGDIGSHGCKTGCLMTQCCFIIGLTALR